MKKIKITKAGRKEIEEILITGIGEKNNFTHIRIALMQNMIVNMLENDKGFVEVI